MKRERVDMGGESAERQAHIQSKLVVEDSGVN